MPEGVLQRLYGGDARRVVVGIVPVPWRRVARWRGRRARVDEHVPRPTAPLPQRTQSEVAVEAKLEPALGNQPVGFRCQFERLGYFCVDKDTTPHRPVFNRTVTLKDEWAKLQKKGA